LEVTGKDRRQLGRIKRTTTETQRESMTVSKTRTKTETIM
jgi:hypothetical protein